MKLFHFLILTTIISAINFVNASEEVTLTAGPVTCEYKTKDTNQDYDTSSDVNIKCSDTSCSVSGSGASVSDGILSISSAGTYIVEGSLNGQIQIKANDEDFIHLILNEATITSSDGPAIYGVSANKVTITIIGENALTDSSNYTNLTNEEPDACLFIDSDLSINGSGSLTVTGKYGDAIRCKKDLKLVSGNVIVPSAVQRGIKAKNSICIKDGTIDVTSSNSGIKVTRDDNSDKGYIVVDGGNIAISSGKDALHAETHLTINDGYIDIKNCGEGIEGQMIDILGGEIHVLATDDGINASKISSNDTTTDTMGGPGNSSSSTDSSVYINIVGGKTYVTVQGNDVDGIDSNGVLYIGGEAEVYTSIEGGDIYGNMAALDADGTNAIVSGATVLAVAGSNSGSSPNNDAPQKNNKRQEEQTEMNDNISNKQENQGNPGEQGNSGEQGNPEELGSQGNQGGQGSHLGPGGIGGMGETGSIYQAYIQTSVNTQESGTQITVKDSNDKTILTYTPDISYSSLLISSPSIVAGKNYTIITGDDSIDVTASEADTGSVDAPSVTSPQGNISSSGISERFTLKTHFMSLFIIFAILILF